MASITSKTEENAEAVKADGLDWMHRLQRYTGSRIIDTDEPHSHAVLIFGADQSHGRQRAGWHREYR